MVMFFMQLCTNAVAQTTFCGQISDSTGGGVPFVQVLLQSEGKNSIAAFTQSSSQGGYSFKVFRAGRYRLIFRALSYALVAKDVEVLPDTAVTVTVDVELVGESFSINEVIVAKDRPITVKEDTVVFSTLAFRQGNEQVAEDVLKKLPGIEVSDDGGITWQGKPVEKVMVEGEDVFGRGYRLVTKNMQANAIDKVEVYEHYSNNPMLKGIEESDKVALNLTLTEEKRFATFGNVGLGYATNKSYEAKTSAISVSKQYKGYLFGNANSIGSDAMGDIGYIVNSGSNQDEEAYESPEVGHFISLRGYTPNLGKNRVPNSQAGMLSANGIFTLSTKTTLNVVAVGAINSNDYQNDGYTRYLLTDTTFTNTVSKSTCTKIKNGLGRIELRHKPSSTAQLDYSGQVYYSTDKSSSNLTYNNLQSVEGLGSETVSTVQSINFTGKLSSKTAVQVMARYRFNRSPENYRVSNFYLAELFPQLASCVGQYQHVNVCTHDFMLRSKLIARSVDSWVFDASFGADYSNNHLKSVLYAIDSVGTAQVVGSGFFNNVGLNKSHLFAEGSAIRKLGNVSLSLSAKAHADFVDADSTSYRKFYLGPRVSLSWIPNRSNALIIYYMQNASSLTLTELTNGYILVANSSLSRGLGGYNVSHLNTALLSYRYGQMVDRFFMQTSVLYSRGGNQSIGSSQIASTYSLSGLARNGEQEMLSASLTADIYIKPLQSNLKLKTSHVYSSYQYILNNKLSAAQQNTAMYGGEFRSAFDGFFNYHFGTTFAQIDTKTGINSKYMNNNQFLDLLFTFGKKFTAEVNLERFEFGRIESPDNPWYFIDLKATYTHKPDGLSVSIVGSNIMDNNQFGIYSYGEVVESSTIYRIAPRYVMLSVMFRF